MRVDISGLIAPQSEIELLMKGIEENSLCKLKEINAFIEELHKNYYNNEWSWPTVKLRSSTV